MRLFSETRGPSVSWDAAEVLRVRCDTAHDTLQLSDIDSFFAQVLKGAGSDRCLCQTHL